MLFIHDPPTFSFLFIFDAAQYLRQSHVFRELANDYDHEIENNKIITISELVEKKGMNNLTLILFRTKLITLFLASLFFITILLKQI